MCHLQRAAGHTPASASMFHRDLKREKSLFFVHPAITTNHQLPTHLFHEIIHRELVLQSVGHPMISHGPMASPTSDGFRAVCPRWQQTRWNLRVNYARSSRSPVATGEARHPAKWQEDRRDSLRCADIAGGREQHKLVFLLFASLLFFFLLNLLCSNPQKSRGRACFDIFYIQNSSKLYSFSSSAF